MQRVDAAVVGHGEARGAGRLRRDLAAEQPRPADVAARVEAAEDVAVELLEVEHLQQLGDVARLRFAPIDRIRRVVHAGNRRPAARGAPALRRPVGVAAAVARGGRSRTSSAGLRSKKPTGISMKPVYSTGITGQSSGRTKWVTPNVYQSTTSVSSSGRSAAVHAGRPSPPACWFGNSPAARRSSGAYGVTQRLWRANPARLPTLDSGDASIVGVDIVGTSL